MKRIFFLFVLALVSALSVSAVAADKPNILFITVDDMSCDSIGAFGSELEGISPNVDALAAEGMRFEMAHVQVGNCYPSRNVMFSGRYPHNSGVEGFYAVKPIDYPVMCDLMKSAGYYVAIRGKVSHSTPYLPYAWDDDLTTSADGEKRHLKDVPSYGECTAEGIANAKKAGKPFCLNINISDPHKPFWKPNDPHPASKEYSADEVPVPGFLHDDPAIREELALYYTSVRRADDAVGSILQALKDSGEEENTLVMFLSDHGMPLPFAKTQLYHHSTRTPWIVRWPGVVEAGSADSEHMISAVDLLPTWMDIAGLQHPDGFDGASFLPLLKGEPQEGRDVVYKVYNENAGGNRNPMRGVQTERYLYLFNPWSDGELTMATATNGTATWRRMQVLGREDSYVQERVDLMKYRVPEELYDVVNDPDCRHNLIDEPKHAKALADLRKRMEKFMVESNDPILEVFRKRDDAAARKTYVEKKQAEADERRKRRRSGNRNKNSEKGSKGAKNKQNEKPAAAK